MAGTDHWKIPGNGTGKENYGVVVWNICTSDRIDSGNFQSFEYNDYYGAGRRTD